MGVCGSKREGKPAAAEKYSRDDPKVKDTILEVLEEALPRLMPQKVTHVHKTLVNVNNNVEANQMLLVNNPDPPNGQPQPDERITQAEYEKVVKGARLTDPVEEPISRSCTKSITSLIFHNDNPVYTCDSHIHTVNDNGNESSLIDCNKHT